MSIFLLPVTNEIYNNLIMIITMMIIDNATDYGNNNYCRGVVVKRSNHSTGNVSNISINSFVALIMCDLPMM